MMASLLTPLLGKAVDLIDDVYTSDEERAAAKLELAKLEHRGKQGQLNINMMEARHRTIFVAGWRPCVGWICAFGLLYATVLLPMSGMVFHFVDLPITAEQLDMWKPDTGTLMTILMGMLGLGGLRTYEKKAGITK